MPFGAFKVISASCNQAWVRLKFTSILLILAPVGILLIAKVLATPVELKSGIDRLIDPELFVEDEFVTLPPDPPLAVMT